MKIGGDEIRIESRVRAFTHCSAAAALEACQTVFEAKSSMVAAGGDTALYCIAGCVSRGTELVED